MKRLINIAVVIGLLFGLSIPTWAAWSTPTLWPHNTTGVDRMPSISGNTLYYIKDYDIWQSSWDGSTWSEPTPAPGKVNSPVNEINATVVKNGTVMYFVRMNGTTNYDFFRSQWDAAQNGWSEPVLVTEFSSPTQDWDIWVNEDETSAYITSAYAYGQNVPTGRNVFASTRNDDGTWSLPQSIGTIINSSLDEWDVSVDDAGHIYFCSNMPGSQGDFDIYMADSLSGPISNVTAVNSVATEKSPSVSAKWLFFEANKRTGAVGNYDIWFSTWE